MSPCRESAEILEAEFDEPDDVGPFPNRASSDSTSIGADASLELVSGLELKADGAVENGGPDRIPILPLGLCILQLTKAA